jgi:hypothetical protein
MLGAMIRRVAIDDDDQHSGYSSPRVELDAFDAYDTADDRELVRKQAEEYDEARDDFEAEVANLRERGWSEGRIAVELYATEGEVRAVPSFERHADERQTPEETYGLEPEFE